MGTIEQRQAFIDMVLMMRAASGSELGVSPKDLQNVLLGFREEQ